VPWRGKVLEETPEETPIAPDTRAIQALDATLKADSRVTLSRPPPGDGLTLAGKH